MDDNPFLDDWIGHPIMDAISGYIELQNNPRQGCAGAGAGEVRTLGPSSERTFSWPSTTVDSPGHHRQENAYGGSWSRRRLRFADSQVKDVYGVSLFL
jgi:hypothetical protein